MEKKYEITLDYRPETPEANMADMLCAIANELAELNKTLKKAQCTD